MVEVEVEVDTNTLLDFANWYKSNNFPQQISQDTKIYQTDMSISFTIFKQGIYQVEFYIAKPNFKSSKHYHPFEQVIIPAGGSGRGRRGTDLNEEPEWKQINHTIVGKILHILPANTHWHQIESYDKGLYFYNCQKWSSTSTTSAVVEYIGESLGPIHDSIIRNSNG